MKSLQNIHMEHNVTGPKRAAWRSMKSPSNLRYKFKGLVAKNEFQSKWKLTSKSLTRKRVPCGLSHQLHRHGNVHLQQRPQPSSVFHLRNLQRTWSCKVATAKVGQIHQAEDIRSKINWAVLYSQETDCGTVSCTQMVSHKRLHDDQ